MPFVLLHWEEGISLWWPWQVTVSWAKRSRGSEIKKIEQVNLSLGGGVLQKLRLMPRKLVNKYSILYAIFRERDGTESKESYHTIGWNQQEASQAVMHKGNMESLKSMTDGAHSGLRADDPGLYGEKPSAQELKHYVLWDTIFRLYQVHPWAKTQN